MFEGHRRRGVTWLVGAALLGALIASACSSTSKPTTNLTPPTVTRLISLSTETAAGYTLTPAKTPAQVTAVYAILQVTGPGAVTITGLSAIYSSVTEIYPSTDVTSTTYIATVNGDPSAAVSAGIVGEGGILQATQGETGPFAVWKTAQSASGAVLHAGPSYPVLTVFDIPSTTQSWSLQGVTASYRVNGGPSQILALKISSIQVQVAT